RPAVSGTASPGAVHAVWVGSRVASAPASACATGLRAGRTVGARESPCTLQLGSPATLMHTESGKVQTPFTTPSMSHEGLPSVHASTVVVMPPNSTRQSVAGAPPPPTQSGGQVARAAGTTASTTIAAASARPAVIRSPSARRRHREHLAADLAGD